MDHFGKKYGEYLGFFEEALKKYCAEMNFEPSVLAESMRYSLLSGGKRVRPVLFFASLELFGADYRRETKFALALECIHTYSLIHDDLPAMDNDDFRRGNPSNHRVFGEANAILAGDALLSEAARLLIGECTSEARRRAALALMTRAGAGGMVAGQSADLFYTGREGSAEALGYIYENKTGKLLEAPVVMAAILTGEDERAAEEFGRRLGILFQLTDDLLDAGGEREKLGKTLGKDELEGKLTCLKVYGRDRSARLADEALGGCLRALKAFKGDTSFLAGLAGLVRERDN